MLPQRSTTVRCDVERPSWSPVVGAVVVAPSQLVAYDPSGEPAGTGLVAALVWSSAQNRSSAKPCERTWPRTPGCIADGAPTFSRMLSASPTVEPPLDGGAMPQTFNPR